MSINDAEMLAQAKDFASTIAQKQALLKPLGKSLEKLKSVEDLQRQDFLAEIDKAFAQEVLAEFAQSGAAAWLDEIRGRLRALRHSAKQRLMQGLSAEFKSEAVQILSDHPLALYLHPFTLQVDFEQARATFSYARENIEACALDTQEIAKMHAQLLEQFRAQRVDSKRFFVKLRAAYQMLCIKNGLAPRERVDLVDLLLPLAWLWDEGGGAKKALSPLPKYLLAYQLQKLRKDKLLTYNGAQLDLGVATGGSTRNKGNVVYIPQGPSEGQYYLSITFNA